MKTFCTEGPIDKAKNYYVSRNALIEEGLNKVDDWRYFTIFAPRQSGKTTYFQMLIDSIIKERPRYLPIWISFEDYADSTEEDFLHSFSKDICMYSQSKNIPFDFKKPPRIETIKDEIHNFYKSAQQEIILIIDEIEGLKNREILNNFLHMLRKTYRIKKEYGLRSVILTGVSNITGILQESASPFNIADQIQVPYFTREEVTDLLDQHEQEKGQFFDEDVKAGIYENTLGQPGLVNALSRDLVEKKCPKGERVTLSSFYKTLDDFTRVYIDKNISNVVAKAKNCSEIVKKILFGENVGFDTSDDRISYLYVNGVIDDCDGICCIKIPLYKKRIYNAFRPLANGETEYFKTPLETYRRYLRADGTLDVNALIRRYIRYVSDRGNIIYSQGKASEGVYQYSIDAFFKTYADLSGGHLYPEVPTGGGRVDLILIQKTRTDIIEIKRYDTDVYDEGKWQLYEYLKRSGQKEGYAIYLSEVHGQEGYEPIEIEGKVLHLWIVPIRSPTPSQTSGRTP